MGMEEEEDHGVPSSSSSVVVPGREDLSRCLLQLLQQVEEETGSPEPLLREKIRGLCEETIRIPDKPSQPLTELEIGKQLDELSARLDSLNQLTLSALADPQVQTILSSTSDVWLPAVTASTEERQASAVAALSLDSAKDPK